MFTWITARWEHARTIGKTWWTLVPAVWGLFWAADAVIEKWNILGIKAWWDNQTTHLPSRWQEWLIVLVLLLMFSLVEGSFRFHRAEEVEHATEIDHISKPEKCPVVLVNSWHFGSVGVLLRTGESVAVNGGFQLQSTGETAHEVTLEEFEIEPSVMVTGRVLPSVVGHQIGQGFLLAWIKNDNKADGSKWDLPAAFRRASEARDGKDIWKPNYVRTMRLIYRDHNDFWYRTTQEIIYVPLKRDFEFGPIRHEKLGLNNPHTSSRN